ncbi:MAG: hypothetical protein QME63_02395 [Actinomycetota bacterium]|nr:hypothetical protein [Actinomycetota bacterium]
MVEFISTSERVINSEAAFTISALLERIASFASTHFLRPGIRFGNYLSIPRIPAYIIGEAIFIIIALFSILYGAWQLYRIHVSSRIRFSNWQGKYEEDRIDGIDWQWRWSRDGIQYIQPFCPSCKKKLQESNTAPYEGSFGNTVVSSHSIRIFCTNCGLSRTFEKGIRFEKEKVKQEVLRRKLKHLA